MNVLPIAASLPSASPTSSARAGRRQSSRPVGAFTRGVIAMAGLALLAVTAASRAEEFDIEGKYDVLPAPQPTATGDKIEIVDVFWYGCPHCFKFLPVMERYGESLPEYAEIRRMPAIFRDSWAVHARAFYTAQALGKLDEMHRAFFEAMHTKGAKLSSKAAMAEFFAGFDVDEKSFESAWSSFSVEAELRKTVQMQQRYGVRGTPSVVVNGKYLVSTRKAGNYENMVKIVKALVEREHAS